MNSTDSKLGMPVKYLSSSSLKTTSRVSAVSRLFSSFSFLLMSGLLVPLSKNSTSIFRAGYLEALKVSPSALPIVIVSNSAARPPLPDVSTVIYP